MAASPQQDGIRVRRQPGERAAIAFFEHDPADVPVRVARACGRGRAYAQAPHEIEIVHGQQAHQQGPARARHLLDLFLGAPGEEVTELSGPFSDVVRLRLADQLEFGHVHVAPGRRVFQPGALLNPAQVAARCMECRRRRGEAARGPFPVGCPGPFFFRGRADPFVADDGARGLEPGDDFIELVDIRIRS
jgi:hypothetical protein